jgi:hypothetical protein
MRIFIPAICLLFLSSNSFGQSAPDGNATAQQSLWEKYTAKCFHPKFVVDDQVIDDNAAKKVLDEIDPGAVTRVLIAHGNASQPRDVVYVITGRAKIRVYQEKFAKFSKTYDAYLKSHKNWDGKLAYILNGKAVSGSITEIIDNLYNIPAGQIVGVLFSEGDAFDWATGTVHITTKQ